MSKHSVEYRIAGAAWYRGFTHTIEGHKFYVLSTDLCTLALDMATGAWAERKSNARDNYRVGFAENAYGKAIFGDIYTGKLYTSSFDTYTENGEPIVCIVEPPTLDRDRDLLTLYAVELFAETGVGITAAPNPQVILQYSRDGGRLYSNEMPRSLGLVGEYKTRAIWRLGVQFRTLDLRFTLPSSARRFVLGFFADVR
jgi:hypothetical protein